MRYIYFLVLMVLLPSYLLAQPRNRQLLEKEKKENLEKMVQLRSILKQTASQKQVSLGQLKAIDQQIKTQSNQINLLAEDIKLTDSEIIELRRASNALTTDLDKLRKEYAAMIYAAAKRRHQVNPLGFLFAADNYNQLVARYRYLRQYADARQSQKRQMESVQNLLHGKRQITERKRSQQKTNLVVKVKESQKLEGLKTEQGQVVKQLSQKETELRQELAESRAATTRLDNMITRIIEREIRERAERAERERAERERLARAEAARKAAADRRRAEAVAAAEKAGKPAPAAPEPEPTSTPKADERVMNKLDTEDLALASSFAAARNRLPWPVQHGFVSEHFGRHPHAVLKGIDLLNPGIDIQTNVGEPVRAIYGGVVQMVQFVLGSQYVVAVRHGRYWTVYAKVKNVMVKAGDKVKAREQIGTVSTDVKGVSALQFQVWKDGDKMNPESWLAPR